MLVQEREPQFYLVTRREWLRTDEWIWDQLTTPLQAVSIDAPLCNFNIQNDRYADTGSICLPAGAAKACMPA